MNPSDHVEQDAPLRSAIKHFGSEAKLAAAIGVSQAAVNKAKKREEAGHPVSPELAVRIDRASDGKFGRASFRPDLWEAA